MVHAFTLENGRATYRNRWVRTPRFELERKAGGALFGGFGDPSKSDPSAIGKDFGVANTHTSTTRANCWRSKNLTLPLR